jgi:hypothetical protein
MMRLAFLLWLLQIAPTKGSVEGTVVRAGTRTPLENVHVVLFRNIPEAAWNTRLPASVSVQTDSQGRFVFKDVDAGLYGLGFSANGYVRHASSLITVASGQAVKDLVVGLTPTGSVSGTVRDGDRRPLAGVPVQLLRYLYDDNGHQMLRRYGLGQTDDRGEYRIFYVTPGRYYVSAGTMQGPGGIGGDLLPPANVPRELNSYIYYPGAADPKFASVVDVQPGGNVGAVDFTLSRATLHSVRGRIIDALTGQPPERVRLRLNFREPSTGGEGDAGTREVSRPSYKDGVFEFRNLMPGQYSVIAMIEDPTPAGQPRRSGRTGYMPVEVAGSDVEGVVVTVAANTISGRVMVEGQTFSSVFPADETPGLTLRALVNGARPATPAMINMVAELSRDGSFRFEGVPPGEYHVSMLLPTGFYVKEARFGVADVLTRPFQFTAREAVSLNVVVSANSASVDGAVTDSRMAAAAGAQVVLIPDESRYRPELFKTATTDQNGRFVIRNVAPGNYRLYAWEAIEPNGWFDLELAKRYEQSAQPVRLTESGRQTVDAKLIPVVR